MKINEIKINYNSKHKFTELIRCYHCYSINKSLKMTNQLGILRQPTYICVDCDFHLKISKSINDYQISKKNK